MTQPKNYFQVSELKSTQITNQSNYGPLIINPGHCSFLSYFL